MARGIALGRLLRAARGALTLTLAGCSSGSSVGLPPQDASVDVPVDQGAPDAGTPDNGPTDTGLTDREPTDSGPMDSGPMDSGPMDSGPMDSGPMDGGPADTGPFVCGSSADFVGHADGPSCDPVSRRCVACTAADDRCDVGQRCDDAIHRCVAGCRNDEACVATGDGGTAATRCEPASHTCVECVVDDHCTLGQRCMGNRCVPGCSATRACPATQACCAGGCVDLAADATHCGGCGTACAATGAVAECRSGACAVGSCAEGLGDCDGAFANGCETNTRTALAHCGACGTACPTPANAAPTCAAGACGFTCAAGFANCDGSAANGCEADTRVSASHCGVCGVSCPSGTCRAGACVAPLGTMENPATSCRAVRDAVPGSADGEKYLLVNGAPMAVRCEQSIEGGGWTVVARALDQVYATPPPPIGASGVGSTSAWRAHTWRSGESYYLSLDTFDAMTTATSEVMLYSRDASGAVVSRVILSGVDYDATANRMTITGSCRDVVGSACGASWSWRASPPGFNMAGRSDYCNAAYPDRIWNYHNEVGCASDWGLFAWPGYGASARARPGWIGRYETPAQETVILVR
jgi:hypothetical protein